MAVLGVSGLSTEPWRVSTVERFGAKAPFDFVGMIRAFLRNTGSLPTSPVSLQVMEPPKSKFGHLSTPKSEFSGFPNPNTDHLGCGAPGIYFFLLILLAGGMRGALGPGAPVFPGEQVPQRCLKKVQSLGILSEDERIRYFYSSTLLSLGSRFYLVTDKHLVLHHSEWEEPVWVIPLEEIVDVELQREKGRWADGAKVEFTLADGTESWFPLSNEDDLDRRFVEAIREKMGGKTRTGQSAEQ